MEPTVIIIILILSLLSLTLLVFYRTYIRVTSKYNLTVYYDKFISHNLNCDGVKTFNNWVDNHSTYKLYDYQFLAMNTNKILGDFLVYYFTHLYEKELRFLHNSEIHNVFADQIVNTHILIGIIKKEWLEKSNYKDLSNITQNNVHNYSIEELNEFLEEAIYNEEYEKASMIRDVLNKKNK
jgi:hypothetical protein